jgi:hypothetical protein
VCSDLIWVVAVSHRGLSIGRAPKRTEAGSKTETHKSDCFVCVCAAHNTKYTQDKVSKRFRALKSLAEIASAAAENMSLSYYEYSSGVNRVSSASFI